MLATLDRWLEGSIITLPTDPRLQLRRAEVLFALGRTDRAALLLPPIMLPEINYTDPPESLSSRATTGRAPEATVNSPRVWATSSNTRSRLLIDGSYESFLIAAYQYMYAEDWQAATESFRLASATARDRMLLADKRAYQTTVANVFGHRAGNAKSPALQAYLAGKYYARAGDWYSAENWLLRAKSDHTWRDLLPLDQSRNWMYLGLAWHHLGDSEGAQHAFQFAIDLAPTLAEPQLRFLQLSLELNDKPSIARLSASLAKIGPAQLVNQSSIEQRPRHSLLNSKSSWTLAGYDIDTEDLDTNIQVDLWLWWKNSKGIRPATVDWMPVGNFWIQFQTVENLVPNAGFEWGTLGEHLPLGFRPWSPVSLTSSFVDSGMGPFGLSRFLRMSAGSDVAYLRSTALSIDPQENYFVSFWAKTSGNWATRIPCSNTSSFGFKIGQPYSFDINHGWTNFSYIGPVVPAASTASCEVGFYVSNGWAAWDQVLIAKGHFAP